MTKPITKSRIKVEPDKKKAGWELYNEHIFPKVTDINRKNQQEVNLKRIYPDFYEYLIHNYPEDISFKEKLYWYFYKIDNHPICPICGNRIKFRGFSIGYGTYCSTKCARIDSTDKIKQTCLRKYGVEWASQSQEFRNKFKHTCLEKYGAENPYQASQVKDKIKHICLEKYGVDNYTKTEEYKNIIRELGDNLKQKIKQSYINKYGVDNYTKTEEYKEKSRQTCLEKYGVDNYTKTEEYKKKSYNTRYKNRSFNTSKVEQEFKSWLDSNNINYKYQYKSKKYPWMCDFYFPDKDIYFEINGSWTHGPHPFDPNNPEDILLLERWKSKNTKFYNTAIRVWTVIDPQKIKTAKDNNIKLFTIYDYRIEKVIQSYNSML